MGEVGDAAGLSVLVVDDDEAIRTMLVTFLGKRGWQVEFEPSIGGARARLSSTACPPTAPGSPRPPTTGRRS